MGRGQGPRAWRLHGPQAPGRLRRSLELRLRGVRIVHLAQVSDLSAVI